MDIKNVLITGAGGFVGSHLVEQCVELGWHITAFVHYNSKNSWGWLESSQYKNEIEVVLGDVRDFDSILRAAKGIDTIFHLGALIGIPYSYISPLAYVRTNIEGTYNVIEAARHLDVPNVLITSTSEVYGTAQHIPMDETHPLIPQSPYAATKVSADQLALSYYRSFGSPIKIVRPFNVYGPRQSARAVIPTIILQVLSGSRKIKLGSISPTRDITFVRDTVNGFIQIARADDLFGEVTNIGMNTENSVRDLVELIGQNMGVNIEIESENQRIRPDLSEVERLHCDNTKILTKTAWRAAYTLEQGLAETINWFSLNYESYKANIYNI